MAKAKLERQVIKLDKDVIELQGAISRFRRDRIMNSLRSRLAPQRLAAPRRTLLCLVPIHPPTPSHRRAPFEAARARRRGTCSTVATRIKYALFLALVVMYWSMPLIEVRFARTLPEHLTHPPHLPPPPPSPSPPPPPPPSAARLRPLAPLVVLRISRPPGGLSGRYGRRAGGVAGLVAIRGPPPTGEMSARCWVGGARCRAM